MQAKNVTVKGEVCNSFNVEIPSLTEVKYADTAKCNPTHSYAQNIAVNLNSLILSISGTANALYWGQDKQ